MGEKNKQMSMKICKLLRQDTTQKLRLPCLCPLHSHPDEITSLKSPASSPKLLSEADKWQHLPFTQAEGQKKQTDLNFFLRFKVSLFVAGCYILRVFFNLAYTKVFKIKKS